MPEKKYPKPQELRSISIRKKKPSGKTRRVRFTPLRSGEILLIDVETGWQLGLLAPVEGTLALEAVEFVKLTSEYE